MIGMTDQLIFSENANKLRDLLLQSRIYSSRFAEANELERMSLLEIHNTMASEGGVTKDDWLSSRNIVNEEFFVSEYKGVTSGRSGRRAEYTKSSEWVRQRDLWRQDNLSRMSGSEYAVINVASRLFPHDAFDLSILDSTLSRDDERRLCGVFEYYKDHDIAVIFRGFPARIIDSLQLLLQIQRHHQVTIKVLTTGWPTNHPQRKTLEENFGKCNLFSEYGAQDLGIQLYSCKICGMYHAENPRSLITVCKSKIFSTDLYSHTQPVIAADTGDLASVKSVECPVSAGLVFIPVCMPPVLPVQPTRQQDRSRNDTLGKQNLLLSPRPHPDLESLLGSNTGKIYSLSQDCGLDYRKHLFEILADNDISGCRSLVERALDRGMLLSWRKRDLSLLSFLIGFLVVTDSDQWIDVACPWLDNKQSDSVYTAELLTVTRSKCERILMGTEAKPIALLVVDIVMTLFSLDLDTSFIDSLDSVEGLLEELCRLMSSFRPMPACLPLGSSIRTYISAYCWRHRKDMLDVVLHSFSGHKTSNMNLIEERQALGFMRKT